MAALDTSDMLLVHAILRDGFAGLPALVEQAADPARVELVGDWAGTLLAFLRAHHESEDALVWPRVLERSPADAPLVGRLEAQHEHLVELLDATHKTLAGWTSGAGGGRDLTARVVELAAALGAHLAEEETHGIPVIAACLTQQEWAQLPGHAMRSLATDKPWLVLGLVRDRMTPEQRDAMLAHLPPPVAQMWLTTGEPSYKAFMTELGI